MKAEELVVFHVDVNSASLSWEAVYRLRHLGAKLDLRTIPSAVDGDVTKRHGIILTKSVPTKVYGIHTGQSVPEAVQRRPELYLVPPNYNLYQRSSEAFLNILRGYEPRMEQYSVDETYMDASGTRELPGEPEKVADEIWTRVREELGSTVNIGVENNKLTAKVTSEFRKPDRTHTFFQEEIPKKLWPLPVSELFYMSRATFQKFHSLGIHTIGELAHSEPQLLWRHLHKHGEVIWAFADGIDAGGALAEPEPNKGYGNSTTISFDITGRETARMVLLSLAEAVAARLRAGGVEIRMVAVSIRNFTLETYGHQITLHTPTDVADKIWECACRASDESWDGISIHHLEIHTMGVSGDRSRQLGLFDAMDYERKERLDKTIDAIRRRFGNDAVMRVSFLGTTIDHMNGGTSRKERSVDYNRGHMGQIFSSEGKRSRMSAFGIGTDVREVDSEEIRGRQIEIACKTWFTSTGPPRPLSFKYEGDDRMIQSVAVAEIVSSEDKNCSGIPSKEYECRAIIDGLLHEFKLVFHLESCRWVIVLPQGGQPAGERAGIGGIMVQ